MHVVDCGWTSTKQKSGLCSAQWTGYSHLGLLVSGLRFLIKMKDPPPPKGLFPPFGGGGSVVPSSLPFSLPPSLCWLTLLPGHCAHSLSVTISSKLCEAHYFHVPPGGDDAKQHLHKEAQTLYGWLAKYRNLSLNSLLSLCALSVSSLPLLLIFLHQAEKGWIRMTFPLAESTITSEHSLNQLWEPGWLLFTLWWALNCVSSPQDAEDCSVEQEREINVMQNRLNRTFTHIQTYMWPLIRKNT